MRFRERLDPRSFADDEVMGIAAVEAALSVTEVPETSWTFVSERLYERLLSLGQAYSLHFATLLDSHAERKLNSVQCECCLEEVGFLAEVISDPALSGVLEQLLARLVEAARHPNMVIWFSPP